MKHGPRASTVAEYLDALPEDRRRTLSKLRTLIRKNLPDGYKESLSTGALTYEVPLKAYPDTYNGKPLAYIALASQKNYNALYLMGPYADPEQRKFLENSFAKAGKKLDMGKSCVRFKTLQELELRAIEKLVSWVPMDEWIARAKALQKK